MRQSAGIALAPLLVAARGCREPGARAVWLVQGSQEGFPVARGQRQSLVLSHNLFSTVGRDGHQEARERHPAVGRSARKESLKIGGDPQVDAFVTLAGCS